jgi:hypothetical protein
MSASMQEVRNAIEAAGICGVTEGGRIRSHRRAMVGVVFSIPSGFAAFNYHLVEVLPVTF